MVEADGSIATAVGIVPAGVPAPPGISRFRVLLIKPSKYDDDGYVMRFARGVLPSNTLATLAALTEEAVERGDLGPVEVSVHMMDETVQRVDPARLARKHMRRGTRCVVALCGVQTNQFPRAADLARQFKAAGIPVMIGGFHVSGAIAMSLTGMPPECQELMDAGITLVKGEVEECWGSLLRDALHDRLETFYDVVELPDLSKASIPVVDPKLMKRFAYPYMGTIDAGRGCPFNCSFCTIINVQGKKMRHRLASRIKERVRRNRDMKIDYYFFTDDNFSRNPNWEEIFDAMIQLREEEGLAVQFMMQVDTISYRLPGFVEKAARAGCSQVFIGMETINQDNIPASGKKQNRVSDYRNMIDAWHERGIACHVGYIIGFPHDTVESVRDDVRRLGGEIGVDQASFFMLTPIPGSRDHQEMVSRKEWMDDDLNRFDSFHPAMNHPRMTQEEWFGVYRQAWEEFYSVDGMKEILARANKVTYWGLFKNFAWYKYAAIIEGTHPMICGFFRIKDRRQRRPGYAVEGRWRHFRRRARELAAWTRSVIGLYFELQEVWLATQGLVHLPINIGDLKRRVHLPRNMDGIRSRVDLHRNIDELRQRYGEVRGRLGESAHRAGAVIRGSALSRRLAARISAVALRTRTTRSDLDAYWKQTFDKLRRGRVFRINPITLTVNFVRDVQLCLAFNLSFLGGYGQ